MEQMIDLLDLLKHHILDLTSAEDQIIEALPAMIDKASNPALSAALKDHLQVTKVQRTRLQQVQKLINKENGVDDEPGENKGGFFSRLFGGSTEKCKAMEGLITEGEKIMAEDMVPEVMDAAIIAAAQKIEHYEISGYGTARAFAIELRMEEVEKLLTQTLEEEYQADDSLTELAVGKVNKMAEEGASAEDTKDSSNSSEPAKRNKTSNNQTPAAKKNNTSKAAAEQTKRKGAGSKNATHGKEASAKKSAPKKAGAKKSSTTKTAPRKTVVKKASAKKSSPNRSAPGKTAAKKGSSNKSAPKKSDSKKAAPKKGSSNKYAPKKAPAKNKAVSNKSATKKSAGKRSNRSKR